MPEISVIVPVYNTEQYLHRCIDSILAQTFTDFELILVDDGSTDESGIICDEYTAKDDRVHVIHQVNRGAASARNTGVESSKGEYLCFVDSDDLAHPQMLERLFTAVSMYNSEISLCMAVEGEECPDSFFDVDAFTEMEYHVCTEQLILDLYKQPLLCWVIWGRIIKKDLVKRNLFTEDRFHEDTITLKWLLESKSIAFVRKELYFYRYNPGGLSKSKTNIKKAIDGVWAVEEQLQFARNKGYKKLEKQFVPRLLYESANAFFTVKEEDLGLANKIKKRAFYEWVKNGRGIQFKKGEKAFFFEMIAPHIMWMYWKINRKK